MRARPAFAALLSAVLSAVLVAADLAAQGAAPAPRPPIESCSYDGCALRVEPGRAFFGAPVLLRGAAGERVGRFGLRGPDLAGIVAGSDSAVAHARAFRPHQRRAGLAGLLSTAAGVTALVLGLNDANDDNVWPASIAAGALGAYAGYEARLAQRELSRAVWWYNRDVGRE